VECDVNRLVDLANLDRERLGTARKRQCAVWEHRVPDRRPICFSAPLTDAQKAIPAPNYRDAFYDADLMLCGQMRAVCGVSNARSDAVPSVRVNFGTGTILSCVGLEQQVFEDKMPWLTEHLTREQVSGMTPDDIRIRGTFERGMEMIRYFRSIVGDAVPIYCMDTQGPFDLAHLMIGDDLFYALYDDPPFVHHLMELALELGIRTHTWMKEAIGEPLTQFHHSNGIYAENMGVRICEDTTAIVGPEAVETFAMPYTRRLARHFGGAWMHYCGRSDHLTEAACAMPEIRALNFGHVPGHQYDHPFDDDLERCLKSGTVYWGNWPRFPGESGAEYLRRLHKWASQGCLIPQGNAALGGENGFGSVPDALDFWTSLENS
jgi:uroporphyrinogen-III decarboxylase